LLTFERNNVLKLTKDNLPADSYGRYDQAGDGSCRQQVSQVDQLAKQAAQIALRLAALPVDGRSDPKALQEIEELARGILQSVAAIRMSQNSAAAGETRGMWRAMQPLRRQ
jgi:hypothetical protein